MSDTVQKLRVLSRLEMMLLKIHMRLLAKKAVLCGGGLLAGLLAVGMVNVALYLFLAKRIDTDASALIVAVINATLAAGLFLIAARSRPGPEAGTVEELRDLAVAELQADVDAVRQNFNEMRDDVQRIRSGISGVFSGGGPLRSLMHLSPLLDVVTGSLKRLKKK